MSGERPVPSGPLWPEGISKVRPVENHRRQIAPTGESSGVAKHEDGAKPRDYNGGHSATTGSGETLASRQGDQEHSAILPSYYNDIFLKGDAKWLDPKKDKELLRGWDSFAEFAVDKADIIAKPNRPNIPKDDLDAIDEDNLLAHDMTADEWEEEVLFALDAAEDRHLFPEFKRHMQEYRRAVKGIVELWRENDLL